METKSADIITCQILFYRLLDIIRVSLVGRFEKPVKRISASAYEKTAAQAE